MRSYRLPLMTLAACSLLLPAGVATAQQSSPDHIIQAGAKARARQAAQACDADCCDGCGYGYGYGNGKGCRNGCGYGCQCGCNNGGKCRCGRRGRRNQYGAYGYGCPPGYGQCGLGRWLNQHSPYHTCTHSPDHGFAPPAQRPIWPQPAVYRNMWAGQGATADPGARHPMVYMPTDTTQLGYYYQQVPFWRSRPGMIPPVPQPDEWHTPDTGVIFTGFEDAETYYMNHCPPGQVIDGGTSSQPTTSDAMQSYLNEGTPTETSSVPMMESNPQPYSPQPVSPQMVPPSQDNVAPGLPAATQYGRGTSAALPQLMPVPRR